MKPVVDWIENRTGLVSAVGGFFTEEIPASSGWHQVLGSVAVFAFLVQVVTGILLAFNYAPTAGEAYDSLKYIVVELTGGRLIRQLHHWGASLMIVVVVLHMVQVFLWGAYKKPREATWIVGVVLLLLTLAYGITGYLLPWDNRAYWGTVVTTQIAASAPFAGKYIAQLMGVQDGQVGAVTFARFYAIHVLLLPPATMALILLHVALVRRHGVAPAPEDDQRPKKSFYPGQVFKDTLAVFAYFMVLYLMAVAVRVPLERQADPTDLTYIPRPDWYFLFLFQLLKLFPGPLEIVGSVVLPTFAILALLAAPFIDRTGLVAVRRRIGAATLVVLAAVGWGSLTYAAIATTPKNAQSSFDATLVEPWQYLAPRELAKPDAEAPEQIKLAVRVYIRNGCGACHNVNGEGGKIGPPLNGVMFKRDAAWLEGHFREPRKFVPNSTMPAYNFAPPEMRAMVAYMLSLPPI